MGPWIMKISVPELLVASGYKDCIEKALSEVRQAALLGRNCVGCGECHWLIQWA